MKKTIIFLIIFLLHLGNSLAQDYTPKIVIKLVDEKVVDRINNHTYKTIELGQQIWTISSINNRRYNDGKQIPQIYGDRDWASAKIGAYRICESTLRNSYGYEYNGYAVETKKLCPIGWRVGTIDDYRELAKYLQSDPVARSKYSHLVDTNQYSISEGRPIRCIKEK